MKIIPLGPSAFAFEPDSEADRIGAITADRLRAHGLSQGAIDDFFRYRGVWNDPPPVVTGVTGIASGKAKAAE